MNTPKLQRRGIIAAALAFIARTQHAEAKSPHLLIGSPCEMGIECFSARCRGGVCVEGNGSCKLNKRCKRNYECCSNKCARRKRKGARYCHRVHIG